MMVRKDALPPSVSFVAQSGTGKTTLVEKLIAEFSRRGRRVGVVKHTAHSLEIDREGKDSRRFAAAGASPVALSSPREFAWVQKGLDGEVPLMEILSRFTGEADIVLVEGYKSGPLPKIEVHRAAGGGEMICVGVDGKVTDASLIAVATDADLTLTVPSFPLGDAVPLCDFLAERFLTGAV